MISPVLIPRASLQRRAFTEGAAVDRFLNPDRRSDGIESVILVWGDRIVGDQHRVPSNCVMTPPYRSITVDVAPK